LLTGLPAGSIKLKLTIASVLGLPVASVTLKKISAEGEPAGTCCPLPPVTVIAALTGTANNNNNPHEIKIRNPAILLFRFHIISPQLNLNVLIYLKLFYRKFLDGNSIGLLPNQFWCTSISILSESEFSGWKDSQN
jgi:hypothetical protein